MFEIDRRQRVVAVLAMMAVDLPAEAYGFSKHMAATARLCPGMKVDELPNLDGNARRACLERARELIDEMLSEIQRQGEPDNAR